MGRGERDLLREGAATSSRGAAGATTQPAATPPYDGVEIKIWISRDGDGGVIVETKADAFDLNETRPDLPLTPGVQKRRGPLAKPKIGEAIDRELMQAIADALNVPYSAPTRSPAPTASPERE